MDVTDKTNPSPPQGTIPKSFQSSTLGQALTQTLETSKERMLYKKLPEPSTAYPIDFASSDYLSLNQLPELRAQYLQKLSISPSVFGSGASRTVVNGNSHAMLENRLKAFFGYEAAVLCNSGYDANLAFFEVVPQKGDIIVFDEKVHASIHDGMKVSKVKKEDMLLFKHNNMVEMKKALKAARDRSPTASIFVAVESLYSMDGTMAPLGTICDLADEVNGHVYVDEAHSVGVYGPRGKGLVALHGVENRVLATLATFSKAINCSGGKYFFYPPRAKLIKIPAVILTKSMVQEVISNFSRTWIYTTCTSYAAVIAVDCCIDVLEDGRSEKVGILHCFDNI